MQISDCMTLDVRTVSPQDTLRHAAEIMAEIDAGSLPVGENDRLVGMITDRDIAIRGVGKGRGADALVSDVMTRKPLTVKADASVAEVARQFIDHRVGAVPVVDDRDRVVGVISYVDVLRALVPQPQAARMSAGAG